MNAWAAQGCPDRIWSSALPLSESVPAAGEGNRARISSVISKILSFIFFSDMDRVYRKSRWIVASTFLPCLSDFKWAKFTYISAAAGSITASSRVSMIRKRLLLQKRLFVVCIRTSIRLRHLKHTPANVKKCQIKVKGCREDVKTEGGKQKAVGSRQSVICVICVI